jgi:uncharacterized protein with HEPN domain
MLDHAREAVDMLSGRRRPDLDANRMLNLAVVRLLEIVGEAANRVSQTVQQEHPEVPWPEIVGLRNRITHGYEAIDFDIVWNIVHKDLPLLIEQLEAVLEQ